MLVKSGFFASFSGDKPYSANDFNTLFGDIIMPGVLRRPTESLPFMVNAEETDIANRLLKIDVGPGRAFLDDVWINYDGTGDPFYVLEKDVSNGTLVTYAVALSVDKENRGTNMDLIKLNTQSFSSPGSLDLDNLVKTTLSVLDSKYLPVSLVAVGLYSTSVLYFKVIDLAGTDNCPYAKCNLESAIQPDDLEVTSPVPLKFGGTGINNTPMFATQKNGWVNFPLNGKNWEVLTDYPYSEYITLDGNFYNTNSDMTQEEHYAMGRSIISGAELNKLGLTHYKSGILVSIPATGSFDKFSSARCVQFFIHDDFMCKRFYDYNMGWIPWRLESYINAERPSYIKPLSVYSGGTGYSLPVNSRTNTGFIQFPLNSINPDNVPSISYTTTISKIHTIDTSSELYNMTADILANLECPSADNVWSIMTFACAGRNANTISSHPLDFKRVCQIWRPEQKAIMYVRFLESEEYNSTPSWTPFYTLFDKDAGSSNSVKPGFTKIFSSSFRIISGVMDMEGEEDYGEYVSSGGEINVYNNEAEKYLWLDIVQPYGEWTIGGQGDIANSTLEIGNESELFELLSKYLDLDNGGNPSLARSYSISVGSYYVSGDPGTNLNWQLSLRLWIRNGTIIFLIDGIESQYRDSNLTYLERHQNLPGFRTVFTPIFYEKEV